MSGNRSIGHDARGGHLARAREALDRPTGPATLRAALERLDAPLQWLHEHYPKAFVEMPTPLFRRFKEAERALAAPAADGLDEEHCCNDIEAEAAPDLRAALERLLETIDTLLYGPYRPPTWITALDDLRKRRDDVAAALLEDEIATHRAALAAPAADGLDGLDGWSLAFRDTRTERAIQDAKWGEQNHPAEVWLAILSEEVGEMAKEMLPGGDLFRMRDEAVQVAAVAVAFVEAIDRAREPSREPGERP